MRRRGHSWINQLPKLYGFDLALPGPCLIPSGRPASFQELPHRRPLPEPRLKKPHCDRQAHRGHFHSPLRPRHRSDPFQLMSQYFRCWHFGRLIWMSRHLRNLLLAVSAF